MSIKQDVLQLIQNTIESIDYNFPQTHDDEVKKDVLTTLYEDVDTCIVDDFVDKIASFFEEEENWKALKNCWLENDRSDDLRRLLHKAIKEWFDWVGDIMRKDISSIIKEWKDEAGVKSIILISGYPSFGKLLKSVLISRDIWLAKVENYITNTKRNLRTSILH